eukprot:TRINITY_DN14353_c0_g1_i1.p1 TRINITY_DN14353_c0_g1~~TRINITY_DN14353_c0_g1_i1.p1  ORF type:complete len:391 (+),score=41.70 TRINITY_DN14353_c0_g1_i1:170-1342(+)
MLKRVCFLNQRPKRMSDKESVELLSRGFVKRGGWQRGIAGWHRGTHQKLMQDFTKICESGGLGPESAGVYLHRLSKLNRVSELIDSYNAIVDHGIEPSESMLTARFCAATNEDELSFMFRDRRGLKETKGLVLGALWAAQRLLRRRRSGIKQKKLRSLIKDFFVLLESYPECEEVRELRVLCAPDSDKLSGYINTLREKSLLNERLLTSALKTAVRLGDENLVLSLHKEAMTSKNRHRRGLATSRLLLHYANTGNVRKFLLAEASAPELDRDIEMTQSYFIRCCFNCLRKQVPGHDGVVTREAGMPTVEQIKKLVYERLTILRQHSTWRSNVFQETLLEFYTEVGDADGIDECQRWNAKIVKFERGGDKLPPSLNSIITPRRRGGKRGRY